MQLSTLQKTQFQDRQHPPATPPRRGQLIGRWVKVDGRLVCQWVEI